MTQRELELVVRYLCERYRDAKLALGAQKATVEHLGVDRKTVGDIWKRRDDLSSRKKGRVGRKKKHTLADVEQKMEVPR
ncbi:hypothetical protein PF003_g31921 [Phytophthora fragariae]|nr:hypothetical protein PF003_g31921 [Phytophthora fragariae]